MSCRRQAPTEPARQPHARRVARVTKWLASIVAGRSASEREARHSRGPFMANETCAVDGALESQRAEPIPSLSQDIGTRGCTGGGIRVGYIRVSTVSQTLEQ